MVCFNSSISVCNTVDQSAPMANSVNSGDLINPKSRVNNNHLQKGKRLHCSPNCLQIPACDGSRSAAVDVAILIIVITACGILMFPDIKNIYFTLVRLCGLLSCLIQEELMTAPGIYGSIVLSVFCFLIAVWGILMCTSRKCGNLNCKGLRKAAEFNIQLETEECVKNSNSSDKNGGLKKGLFELPRDHHRELEAGLKKMAPPNGRAVLFFRARCGCSVGRLEVPGSKRQKKIKK